MHKKLLAAVVLSCLICVGALSAPEETSLSEADAFGLVRTVNTAQAMSLMKDRAYPSLHELVQGGSLQRFGPVMNGADSATIKDYQLTVIVSHDRQHYSAALIPANSCGLAIFSSDRAVIYRAKALGCE